MSQLHRLLYLSWTRCRTARGVRSRRSVALLSVGAAFVLAAVPTSAGAFSLGAFTLSPQGPGSPGANTQAGTDADLVSNTITFGGYSSSTDTLKDLSLQLAPGLLVNPSTPNTVPAADLCTSAMLAVATPSCPAGGLIGTGELTANVGLLSGLVLTTNFYLMAPPTPADVAGVGFIVSVVGVPLLGVAGSVDVQPNGTLLVSFANLPQSAPVAGVRLPIQITSAQLTINGTVRPNGTAQVPFTRLPTSCAAALSTVRADAYSAPGAVQSQGSQFTPTGCGELAYAPRFSAATATLNSRDPGLALSTTFTQGTALTDAAVSAISLMLPFDALAPNAGVLVRDACASPSTSGCQPIGAVSVSTPLQGAPVTGKLYAVLSGGLPGLSIVLPPPVSLELDGVTKVGATGAIVETFAGIPDLPISALTVSIPSIGENSLFSAGLSLCGGLAQPLSAVFTPQNGGRPVKSAVQLTPVNCPTLTLPSSQTVRLARRQSGRVAATCSGAPCSGKLTLTVSVAKRTGQGERATRRTVASASFSLRPRSGRSSTITVRLNAFGRALLKRRHLSLNARASVRYGTRVAGGSVKLKG
jgi:hypothetical protein